MSTPSVSQSESGLSSRMQEAIAAASSAPPPEPPPPPSDYANAGGTAATRMPHTHDVSTRSRLDVGPAVSQPSAAGFPHPAVPREADTVYSREQKLQDTLAKANATLAEFRARVGAPAPARMPQAGSPQWAPHSSHSSPYASPYRQSPARGSQSSPNQVYGDGTWQQRYHQQPVPHVHGNQTAAHTISWPAGRSPGGSYSRPPQPSPQSSQRPSPSHLMQGAKILFSSSGSGYPASPFGASAFPPAPPGQQRQPPHEPAMPSPPRVSSGYQWQPPQSNTSPPRSSEPSSRSSSPDSSAAAASAVLDAKLQATLQQLSKERDAKEKLQQKLDGMDTRAAETLQALVAQLATAGVQVRLPTEKQPPGAVGLQGDNLQELSQAVLKVPPLPSSTSEAVLAALAAERARFSAKEAAIRDEMSASSRWYQDMARRAEEDVVAARDKATMDALDAEASASGTRKAFEERVRQRSMQVVTELRSEIQSLQAELEDAHDRHTMLERQVREQFESHCRSFENRLRGRASAAISAIRHASEVAAQHHYTRQLRAARDAIKNNLLQQSVAGVVDMTAVDKLFADLALMPMLGTGQAHVPDWSSDVRTPGRPRRPSEAASVGASDDALHAVMLDSQAAASEALQFFSATLQGGAQQAAAPVASAAAAQQSTPVQTQSTGRAEEQTSKPVTTPPKPVSGGGAETASVPGAPPARGATLPPQARPPPPRPPMQSVSVPSTSAPREVAPLAAAAPTSPGSATSAAPPRPVGHASSSPPRAVAPASAPAPPRPPPGVSNKNAGRASITSVASTADGSASTRSTSSAERPSTPPSASALPRRRALTARAKPGAIKTGSQTKKQDSGKKDAFLRMLTADASSFKRSPGAVRQVIHDKPLNPTRARRLRQQSSPSPTGNNLTSRIRSRIFK